MVALEREVLLTGIGGQGVQLGAELIARAAVAEGRQVQLFGSYGGMMRGGNTDATLVVADAPVQAPPTVSRAWSAIVMHPEYAAFAYDRIRPESLLVVNTTVVTGEVPHPAERTLRVPAGDLATELGSAGVLTMVAVGAYAAATGLVSLDALLAELPDALPPYRRKHIAVNERALAAGHALVAAPMLAAWPEAAVPA